jgi:hypothetical protein
VHSSVFSCVIHFPHSCPYRGHAWQRPSSFYPPTGPQTLLLHKGRPALLRAAEFVKVQWKRGKVPHSIVVSNRRTDIEKTSGDYALCTREHKFFIMHILTRQSTKKHLIVLRECLYRNEIKMSLSCGFDFIFISISISICIFFHFHWHFLIIVICISLSFRFHLCFHFDLYRYFHLYFQFHSLITFNFIYCSQSSIAPKDDPIANVIRGTLL